MSERMQEAALAAAQLLGLVVAGVVLYQMGQPEVGSLVIGAALGHAAPRRARRGAGGSAVLALLGVMALGGTLVGCGASAIRTHATSATIATIAAQGARDVLMRSADEAIARCNAGPADARATCLDEAERVHRDAGVAFDAARLAIAGYRDAVEVAALAGDEEIARVVLERGASFAMREWDAFRELLRALGADVDALLPGGGR